VLRETHAAVPVWPALRGHQLLPAPRSRTNHRADTGAETSQYTVTLKFDDFRSLRNLTQVFREDHFVAERMIPAPNRQAAVRKALQWFSTRFNGSVGSAREILTVDDPYHEVIYDQDFGCNDLRNKFLPEEVLERLIAESNGELVRDTRSTKLGHPLGAVRRRKRRVKFKAKAIAPCVYQNDFGTLFYRITEKPQVSRSGMLLGKHKTRLVRLAARTLREAVEEIQTRRLPELHQSRRVIKRRSFALLQQLAEAPVIGLPSLRLHGNGGAGLNRLFPPNGARAGSRRDRHPLEVQDCHATALNHLPRRLQVLALQAR
jgi:hypothetical protein